MLSSVVSLLIAVAGDTIPPRPITQLVHRMWTMKEGAPVGIRSLAQTRDGYIWLGTAAGLVRFDGVRFVQFVPQRGDTLPTVPSVSRLMAARDGSLWVVWRLGGVTRLRDGRVTNYGERAGLATAFQLAESKDGTLIAATTKGLARFVSEKWEDVSRTWAYPGTQATAVWFDRDDGIWVQTQDRVVPCKPNNCNFKLPAADMTRFGATIDMAGPDARERVAADALQRMVEYVNDYVRTGMPR